jgi:hypothetical protein
MYDWAAAQQGIPNHRGNDDPLNLCWDQHGRFPDDWTRYLVLDPGHSTTAVIIAAVPPPPGESTTDWGDVIVIEDEIYLHKATCADTAKKVFEKVGGRYFEAFIIDMHAGRQTPMGGSKTIKQQYAEAFEARGLRSRRSGSSFINGSDNTVARREILRTWMQNREHGGTRLRVVLDRTPGLQREFKTYRKRITGDNFMEDEPAKSPHDSIDACEYLAAFDPKWVRPEPTEARGLMSKFMERIDSYFNKDKTPDSVFLGAGSGK